MCEYAKENKCSLTNDCCPYIYWCDKVNAWRELKSKPNVCQIAARMPKSAPNGYCRVLFSKHGDLYIEQGDHTIMVKNPFDYVPNFVLVEQDDNGGVALKLHK